MDVHHMSILQIVIDLPVGIVLGFEAISTQDAATASGWILHVFSSCFLTDLVEVFPFVFISLVYLRKKRGCQFFCLLVKQISVLLE